MVGHGGSSAGSDLADPTSPIPSHCASIVVTSTVRVNVLFSDFDMSTLHNTGCIALNIIVYPHASNNATHGRGRLTCFFSTFSLVHGYLSFEYVHKREHHGMRMMDVRMQHA